MDSEVDDSWSKRRLTDKVQEPLSQEKQGSDTFYARATTRKGDEEEPKTADLDQISRYVKLVHPLADGGCDTSILARCADDILKELSKQQRDICVHVVKEAVMRSKTLEESRRTIFQLNQAEYGMNRFPDDLDSCSGSLVIPPSDVQARNLEGLSQEDTERDLDDTITQEPNDGNDNMVAEGRLPVKREPRLADKYPRKKSSGERYAHDPCQVPEPTATKRPEIHAAETSFGYQQECKSSRIPVSREARKKTPERSSLIPRPAAMESKGFSKGDWRDWHHSRTPRARRETSGPKPTGSRGRDRGGDGRRRSRTPSETRSRRHETADDGRGAHEGRHRPEVWGRKDRDRSQSRSSRDPAGDMMQEMKRLLDRYRHQIG